MSFSCTCSDCSLGCSNGRPGWPTPAGARRLIDAGHGDRLMLDWWSDQEERVVLLLTPALEDFEGQQAPAWPQGRCTFHTDDGLCAVHELKPLECAESGCAGGLQGDAYSSWRERIIVGSWDTEDGRSLVAEWCRERGVEPETSPSVIGAMEILAGVTMAGIRR